MPGSFTGEALRDELLKEISKIKQVKNNASNTIPAALIDHKKKKNIPEQDPKFQYKHLHLAFKEAAASMDFDKSMSLKAEYDNLLEKHPHLKDLDLDSINLDDEEETDLPADPPEDALSKDIADIAEPIPPYFNIAKLQGITEDNTILLDIAPENVPTAVGGDGCSVNLKGSRLLESEIGFKCPFMRCSSHIASGTLRRLCNSANALEDATSLYNNLRSILLHFNMSPKSTEYLKEALSILEMNQVHILNWGSTRMSGFLDGCYRC